MELEGVINWLMVGISIIIAFVFLMTASPELIAKISFGIIVGHILSHVFDI